jgi:hypothetical protein
MKRKTSKPTIPPPVHRGTRAHAGRQTLRTWTINALPLVKQLLERMQLEKFLARHLPRDGRRMVVPSTRGLLLLLRNILLSREPLYVADCKLATRDNLQYIHNQGGRFVTILPRTRREDSDFRQQLRTHPDAWPWDHLYDLSDDDDVLIDRLRVCQKCALSSEGFRLLWFHSTRKAQRDALWRTRVIERVCQQLTDLHTRIQSPRSRFREPTKVEAAVQEILQGCGAVGDRHDPGNAPRRIQASHSWAARQGHAVRQGGAFPVSPVLDLECPTDPARRSDRRRISVTDQSTRDAGAGSIAGLQTSTVDREAILPVQVRL